MTTMTTGAGAVPEFTIQDRLRKARDFAGLEQQELADRMGVSRRTVGNAEHGHVKVRAITVKAWAMATGVSLEWLETGSAEPSPHGPDGGGASPTIWSVTPLQGPLRHLVAA